MFSNGGLPTQEEERRALEGLWDEFHQRLCRFICSRMPEEGDAEDILQDVFLRIHTNLAACGIWSAWKVVALVAGVLWLGGILAGAAFNLLA